MLSMNGFKKEIETNLVKELGENSIIFKEINKNNGVVLNGIIIRENDSNIAPTIYIDEYYRDYVAGNITAEDVSNLIINLYQKNKVSKFDVENILNKDYILENTNMFMVNSEKNYDNFLERDNVFCENGDLIIGFKINVIINNEKGTITITNSILDKVDLTFEELKEAAYKNTKNNVELSPMQEVLESLDSQISFDELPYDMLILSNNEKVYGASSMLNEDVLKSISEKMGNDEFYIVPSSVHECIIKKIDVSVEDIEELIRTVNETQVAPEEILSGHVYIYNKNERQISYYNDNQKELCINFKDNEVVLEQSFGPIQNRIK